LRRFQHGTWLPVGTHLGIRSEGDTDDALTIEQYESVRASFNSDSLLLDSPSSAAEFVSGGGGNGAIASGGGGGAIVPDVILPSGGGALPSAAQAAAGALAQAGNQIAYGQGITIPTRFVPAAIPSRYADPATARRTLGPLTPAMLAANKLIRRPVGLLQSSTAAIQGGTSRASLTGLGALDPTTKRNLIYGGGALAVLAAGWYLLKGGKKKRATSPARRRVTITDAA